MQQNRGTRFFRRKINIAEERKNDMKYETFVNELREAVQNCMGEEIRLALVESVFADIIWENEPISSGELVKLCEEKLNWKKSTTYTVLRKLCARGIFQNKDGKVTLADYTKVLAHVKKTALLF